jgi:alginate O-acetyltransferase complex protein AlgJ
VTLFVPGLLTARSGVESSQRTGEAPAKRPSLFGPGGFGAWARDTQNYLRVSFGLRESMIEWDARLKMKLALDQSYGSPFTVGRSGWLFYRVHRGTMGPRPDQPFSPDSLERWAASLESKQRLLEARGIHFLVVVAPDKQTVYPDMLPRELPPARSPSRLDALLHRLAEGGKVTAVDVRPGLVEARQPPSLLARWPIYYRTDTHWNDLGGLVASRQVLARLQKWFPAVQIPADDELDITAEETKGGDIARMQGLQGQLSDVIIHARRRNVRCEVELRAATHHGEGPETALITQGPLECPGAPIGRGLILHDSMMMAMLPTLAAAFQHSFWSMALEMDLALVEREHPDVVILELVERTLREGSQDDSLARLP